MSDDTHHLPHSQTVERARILGQAAFLYAVNSGKASYTSRAMGGPGEAPARDEVERSLGRDVVEALDELQAAAQRYRRLSREAVERMIQSEATSK